MVEGIPRCWSVLVCLVLISAAGLVSPKGFAEEGLEVAGRYPLPGNVLRDAVVVYFNEPIVRMEASESEPFTFEPSLDGDVEWGDRYVAFRPTKPPTGRRLYEVTLSSALRSTDGLTLSESARRFSVPSHSVTLREPVLSAHEENTATVHVSFSDAVDATGVETNAFTIVDNDGEAVAADTTFTSDGRRAEVRFRVDGAPALPGAAGVGYPQ